MHQIIYDKNDHSLVNKIERGGLEQNGCLGLPQYLPMGYEDLTLGFESRFETGNLQKAVKIDKYEYNLFLSTDYLTEKFTQWFFFSIYNTRKGIEYKFNILNLKKNDSLYNNGMKILMYSMLSEKHD